MMEKTITGWVIVNHNHPRRPDEKQMFPETFKVLKKDCIKGFVNGSGGDWNFWKRKYNFRVVRAKITVSVIGSV